MTNGTLRILRRRFMNHGSGKSYASHVTLARRCTALVRWQGALNYIDQNWFKGKLPFTLHDRKADHLQLQTAEQSAVIHYPKPDNQLSFDKPSSVYLANTAHDEDQPCHLKLKTPSCRYEKRCRVLLNRRSVIARRAFMKSSPLPESQNYRLMRKTACTVKPATSKILCRISSGRCPKGLRPQLPEYVICFPPRQRRVFCACVLPLPTICRLPAKKSTPSGVPVLSGNRDYASKLRPIIMR